MAMGLVDAALVGRVSDADLAAVSIGNAIAFAVSCPGMGVTLAIEPLTSQAIGANEPKRAWTVLRAGVLACFALALPTMLAGWGCTFGLAALGVDRAVIPLARSYVDARMLAAPAWLFFMAGKAYLEARGLTRPILIAGWTANVVNVVLASALVFGDAGLARVGLPPLGVPPLGCVGAGIATALSTWFLAAWALIAAYRARPAGATIRRDLGDFAAQGRKILRLGVPIGFQLLTEIGVFSFVAVLAARLGARTSAAHQIALGLASFTFMGVIGLGAATAVRVGRAIGARDEGGTRRAGLVGVSVSVAYAVACGLVFVVLARPLARLFTSDADVIEAAVPLLRIAAAFQLFDAVQGVAGGALRGAADSAYASWANVVCHWLIGLPLSLLLAFGLGWGAPGLWWGTALGLATVAATLLLRFLRLSSRAIAAA